MFLFIFAPADALLAEVIQFYLVLFGYINLLNIESFFIFHFVLLQMEENEESGSRKCSAAMFCSRTGLFVLMTVYALLGALLFKALEGGEESSVPTHVQKSREDCLKELWLITGIYLVS